MASNTNTTSRGRSTFVALGAGALSATCSTLMFQPFDLVKTRMQTKSLTRGLAPPVYMAGANGTTTTVGMFSMFNTVIQKERFTALWTGISPSLQRCVPSISVYFASVHFLKSSIGKVDGNISPLQALTVGATARSVAACTFLPMTVVKTRFESGHFQYNSVLQALRYIGVTEGTKGLFSGLSATLARDAPFSALYLLFYTQSKQAVIRMTGEEPPPAMYNFPCGVVSGVMASVITQPFDVIKTRMQVKPQTYRTLRETLIVTIRQSGLKGLLTGFVPRATRRTLMASFTWAFYEEIVAFVQRGMNT